MVFWLPWLGLASAWFSAASPCLGLVHAASASLKVPHPHYWSIGRFTVVHCKKILSPKLQSVYTLAASTCFKTPTSNATWVSNHQLWWWNENLKWYFQTPLLVVVRWHLLVQPPKLEFWDTNEGSLSSLETRLLKHLLSTLLRCRSSRSASVVSCSVDATN